MREIPLLCTDEVVRAYLDGRKTQTRRPIKWSVNEVGEPADHLCQIGTSGRWIAWWGLAGQADCQRMTDQHYEPSLGLRQCCEPGDRIWVRETWWQAHNYPGTLPCGEPTPLNWNRTRLVHYAADGDPPNTPNKHYPQGLQGKSISAPDPYAIWIKRPSIHMPRWAARIVLPVVSVRVERVQDISEADAQAEGVERLELTSGILPDVPPPFNRVHPHTSSYRDAYLALWRTLYGTKHPVETTWCWVIETKPFKGALK